MTTLHKHPVAGVDDPTVPIRVAKHRQPVAPRRIAPDPEPDRTPRFRDELVVLACGIVFGGFFGALFGLAWGGVWA